MWFLAPDSFRAFAVFAAIIPAMIGYQAFFALMAGRLWASIDRLQRALASVGYATVVETEIATTVREARRASLSVVVMNVAPRDGRDRDLASPRWERVADRSADRRRRERRLLRHDAVVPVLDHLVGRAPAPGRADAGRGRRRERARCRFPRRSPWRCTSWCRSILSALLLGANRSDWLQPEYRLFWAQAVRL